MRISLICVGARYVSAAVLVLHESVRSCVGNDSVCKLWLPDGFPPGLALPEGMEREVLCPIEPLTLPESRLQWLEAACARERPDLLAFLGNAEGHELAVRLSVRLQYPCVTDVYRLHRDGGLCAVRKTCGSHLDWSVALDSFPSILSFCASAAKTVAGGAPAYPEFFDLSEYPSTSWLLSRELLEKTTDNPIEGARLLLVGGRGLAGKAACEKLRTLSARFGAVTGFTRPAAMNGWCGLDEIVGQSGVSSTPDICVTFGVSGSAAFLAGVRRAGKLIAVNTDVNAPIFRHADVGVVADAATVMEAMYQYGV